jgi:hypothetical protein
MSVLSAFLRRNTVKADGVLPLFHTTPARHLRSMKETNKILATECDVFKPDKLSYFFVGRPAYKYHADNSEAEYWQLPCCFMFEFQAIMNVRRIFPFDSGAFHLYPPYLSDLELDNFEANSAPDAVSRIVGAYFGDIRSYFKYEHKAQPQFEQEFNLDVFDQELKALHRLSREKAPDKFDDRRFTIEMQSTGDVDLSVTNPLAVIAPIPYFENRQFRDHVESTWKALPIGYPTYFLSVTQYYYAIYERVEGFFKQHGLL